MIDTRRPGYITWLPWTDNDYDWGLRVFYGPDCTGDELYYMRSMTPLSIPFGVPRPHQGECQTVDAHVHDQADSLIAYTKTKMEMTCHMDFFADTECEDLIAFTTEYSLPAYDNLGLTDEANVGSDKYYMMVRQMVPQDAHSRRFRAFWYYCGESRLVDHPRSQPDIARAPQNPV